MKKRYISLFVFILFVVFLFSSCSFKSNDSETKDVFYTITFKQQGKSDIVKHVKQGEILLDIPSPSYKKGYNVSWEITDFSVVSTDRVVNAVETPKTYIFILNPNGGTLVNSSVVVVFGEPYSLETPTLEGFVFNNWLFNQEVVASTGIWGYDVDDMELVADWEEEKWSDFF